MVIKKIFALNILDEEKIFYNYKQERLATR